MALEKQMELLINNMVLLQNKVLTLEEKVGSFVDSPDYTGTAKNMVSAKDLSKILNVSLATISRMTTDGTIPAVNIGRRNKRYDLERVNEALGRYNKDIARDNA